MSINPLYVPLFTIEEVILDKDSGLPLSGGVVTFYRDSQRLSPKVVYKISGSSPNYTFVSVGNELTLGIAGDFVDENGDPFVPYAYPYDADGNLDLYFVRVVSSGAVPQFVREAVPYVDTGTVPPAERTNTENELSNAQFVEVLFPSSGTTTLSLSGSNTVTPIAPSWDLVTSGTGTVDIERLQPTAAGVPTNPPYTLRISASAGLGASVQLRQRLNNSPSLLRANYISGTFAAAVLSGGASAISMTYTPSTGSSTTIIPSTTIPTDGAYHVIEANNVTPDQVNTAAATGYVDIILTIPTSRSIAITSIQIVGLSYSVDIPFDEQSADRQKDHLFHYYEDATVHQPKADLLTGWNFGLNPWQFYSTSHGNVAANEYTADQTIMIQQNYVASATGNNVSVSQASFTQNQAYKVTAVTATNKFALLQYIDPKTIRPYWGEKLSVRVRAYITTTHSTSARFKVRLMYKAGLPNTTSQTVPVASWAAGDDTLPDVSGDGWTYVTALNDPTYTLTTAAASYDFNQFQLPASSNANMTLGIMFIMMNNMDSTATADFINFERISLVRNDFAIDCAPETFDLSLRKCQFYFAKTFNQGVLAASNAGQEGALAYRCSVAGATANGVLWQFPTVMRTTAPTLTAFNPSAAGTAWYNDNAGANSGASSFVKTGDRSVFASNAQAAGDGTGAIILLHATADARLGK